MATFGSVILYLFFLWFIHVMYVWSKIRFPQRCEYDEGSDLHRQLCFEPLIHSEELIDISLFVGLDYRRPDQAELVWSSGDIPSYEVFDGSFKVRIPSKVRTESLTLVGWIAIDSSKSKVMGQSHKELTRIMTHPIELTSTRMPSTRKRSNLLESINNNNNMGEDIVFDPDSESENEGVPISHWKYGSRPLLLRFTQFDNITLASSILPELNRQLEIRREFVDSASQRKYEPIVFVDDSSLQGSSHREMSSNTSKEDPTMHITFVPTSPPVLFVRIVLERVIDILKGVLSESELDSMKHMVSEENFKRYLWTMLITFSHVILEYLAFQDEWSFFVGRKSYKGYSISAMAFSIVNSVVIFLYLLDNDTSMLVLLGVGKDICWSAWKLCKVTKPKVQWFPAKGGLPRLTYDQNQIDLSHKDVEEEAFVRTCDRTATLHVGLCVYPMVIGVSAYSLAHYSYASWWSWFISSLTNSIYFFGFVHMTPQLYINYKLQSVAHLPIKAFGYKMFNTFIDDVFALVTDMPLKHRIMTLRDDMVFFGFIYQWWIYKVDKTRTNEFGFSYDNKLERKSDSDSDGDFDVDVDKDSCTTPNTASEKEEKEAKNKRDNKDKKEDKKDKKDGKKSSSREGKGERNDKEGTGDGNDVNDLNDGNSTASSNRKARSRSKSRSTRRGSSSTRRK